MAIVSTHVARTLAQHVHEVFGLMGNGNAYFLDALLRETDATFTAVRHEAGAVVAADAHFRTSGRIAAATTTYGAGFTNTLTALAEAAQARIPLVLVVGDEPTSGPRPWDVDQIALSSAVGARTYTVGRIDAAAATVTAIEHALAYRVPVVLAIPYDVAQLDIGEVPTVPGPGSSAPLAPTADFTRAAIRRLATDLSAAERPLLLAGRGAWLAGAGHALGELAEATGALTATTALGRGIFPEDHFDLGVAGGFGAPGAMAAVQDADVAVVVGADLNQFTMRFGELFHPETTVWQIDTAPAATHAGWAASCAPMLGWGPRRSAVRSSTRRDPGPRGGRAWTPRSCAPMPWARSWPRTAVSIRAPRPPAWPSCCPRTASWSPTAVTSSPGPTCTGPSPILTGWRWSAPRSSRSGWDGPACPVPHAPTPTPPWS